MIADIHPWAGELTTLHGQIWSLLVRGVRDRRAAARHPTLTSVTPDDKPKARTVVLRAADKASAMLEIHTDLRAGKVNELKANPCASFHIWDSSAHLQLRLEARAHILEGPQIEEVWARVPERSRAAYRTMPAPGTPIKDAFSYDEITDLKEFGVIRFEVDRIDALHLGSRHRRAQFCRSDDWAGQWLVP
jgi:pyridoxamine 5'-phosphate oxidase